MDTVRKVDGKRVTRKTILSEPARQAKNDKRCDASRICHDAMALVAGDRAEQHGDKYSNHVNIAALWSAYLGIELLASQVASMMVLLKVARTQTGKFNRDDFIDIAGYGGVACEIAAIEKWGEAREKAAGTCAAPYFETGGKA